MSGISSTRVVIIGAGMFGLAAAKTYLQVDPSIDLTILEAEDSVGGAWSRSRIFPELATQQPYGHYEYFDVPVEKVDKGETPQGSDDFIPSSRVHSYFVDYSKRYNIEQRIQFNTKVQKVERALDGVKWRIYFTKQPARPSVDKVDNVNNKITAGDAEMIECDKLIIAVGLTSLPHLPDLPTERLTMKTFHCRDLGVNYDYLQSDNVKTVSIYGGGKSAYDAANVGLKAGKRVNWIIRANGGGVGPMIKPVLWGESASNSSFIPVMAKTQPNPLENSWSNALFNQKRWWSLPVYWFNWWFQGIVSNTVVDQWDYDKNDQMRKLKPTPADHCMYWLSQPPLVVADSTTMDRIANGDENISVHRADITKLHGDKIHLSDGNVLESDVLLYATGYATHQPIFSVEDAKELGLPVPIDPSSSAYTTSLERLEFRSQIIQRFPRLEHTPAYKNPPQYTQYRLYRSIVPLSLLAKNDRSLAFVGFVQGAGQAVLSEAVALWSVAWLADQLDVARPIHEIEREVTMLNDFAKMRYGYNGSQIPSAVFEWHSWVKAMFKDLDLELPNKSIFKPWLPADYRGTVQRWIDGRKSRHSNGKAMIS